MENLLLPSKVEFTEGESSTEASLVITPCHYGYGTTLGNTLRRVLLSSLPGAAVEAFKIKGLQHEFSALDGVKEDAVQIILNLKQLAVRVFCDEMVVLKINKKGPGIVTADDIEPNANVEIANKDLVIVTLTAKINFEMEIVVGRGRGFVPAEDKDKHNYDLGTIVIDSIYTPIKDVGYDIEYTRVGDITNYEKLTLNIETNGTITPREAVRNSTRIILDHFSIISTAMGEINTASENVLIAKVDDKEIIEETTSDNKEKISKNKKKKKLK